MRLIRRWGALALAAVTAAGLMGGCTRLEEKTESETVAAEFGGEKIMLDYVMLQMRSAQYSYENMFSAFYGTTDFWGQDYGDGRTIEAYVIDTVMQSIRQTKVLCDYAEENGLSLDDAQKQKVEDAVAKGMEEDEEYREAVGMTEELLRQIYTENALANVAYMKLVEDVDTTVGDDEFIKKDLAYVKLTPSDLEESSSEPVSTAEESAESSEEETDSTEETETSSAQETSFGEMTTSDETTSAQEESASEEDTTDNAETAEDEEEATDEAETTLSEEELTQRTEIENAAKEIRERLDDGEAPADFITDYNEDTTYFTAVQSTSTIGEDSSYVYTADAFALATGESLIYNDESTGAIYIIQCTNDNDEEARQSAIDTEIASRKATLFSEKYADIQDNSPKFKADQDVIGKINFKTALYIPETTEEASTEETSAEEASAEETSAKETSAEETSAEETSEEATSAEETSEEETTTEKDK